MPTYQYQAVSNSGEVKNGSLSAGSEQEAIARLQGQNLIPLSISAASLGASRPARKKNRWQSQKLGSAQVADFTRQLSTLVGAGLPLDRSLAIIRQVSSNEALAILVQELQEQVRGGEPLSRAMQPHPKLFSAFYINFIRSAEMSGNLAESLDDLSNYMEKAQALRSELSSALVYPAILVSVTLLSLFIIVVYVLPEFSQLFADMDAELPAATEFVLSVSDSIRSYGIWLVALIVLAVVYVRQKKSDPVWREVWDARFINFAIVGDLIQKVEMARLSRSLGTLLKGGVPLLLATKIARDSLQNRVMVRHLDEVSGSLQEGSGLAQPLLQAGVFPEFALQMIQVGEETGKLDEMLLKVADIYDDEVSTSTTRALSVLEPLLIIGLGLVIGGIIMSILVAILGINDLAI